MTRDDGGAEQVEGAMSDNIECVTRDCASRRAPAWSPLTVEELERLAERVPYKHTNEGALVVQSLTAAAFWLQKVSEKRAPGAA